MCELLGFCCYGINSENTHITRSTPIRVLGIKGERMHGLFFCDTQAKFQWNYALIQIRSQDLLMWPLSMAFVRTGKFPSVIFILSAQHKDTFNELSIQLPLSLDSDSFFSSVRFFRALQCHWNRANSIRSIRKILTKNENNDKKKNIHKSTLKIAPKIAHSTYPPLNAEQHIHT